MTAVPIDDWGRDWTPVPLPMVAVPAPAPAADPVLREMILALQRRVNALGERVAQLEAGAAAATGEFVPFEAQVYGWVGRLGSVVGEEWGVASVELVSARKAAELIRPRFVLIWLVRQVSPMSLPQIGRLMGNRDHSTVNHAINRVEKWRKAEDDFRHVTDQLLVIARRLRTESLPATPDGAQANATSAAGAE